MAIQYQLGNGVDNLIQYFFNRRPHLTLQKSPFYKIVLLYSAQTNDLPVHMVWLFQVFKINYIFNSKYYIKREKYTANIKLLFSGPYFVTHRRWRKSNETQQNFSAYCKILLSFQTRYLFSCDIFYSYLINGIFSDTPYDITCHKR